MKTIKYVFIRLLFEAIGLLFIIHCGIKYGTIEQTIIACIIFSICFLGIIILSYLLNLNDIEKYQKKPQTYRNCKEPYRWVSGIDY